MKSDKVIISSRTAGGKLPLPIRLKALFAESLGNIAPIISSRTAGGKLPLPIRLKALFAESLGNIAMIISSKTAVHGVQP